MHTTMPGVRPLAVVHLQRSEDNFQESSPPTYWSRPTMSLWFLGCILQASWPANSLPFFSLCLPSCSRNAGITNAGNPIWLPTWLLGFELWSSTLLEIGVLRGTGFKMHPIFFPSKFLWFNFSMKKIKGRCQLGPWILVSDTRQRTGPLCAGHILAGRIVSTVPECPTARFC